MSTQQLMGNFFELGKNKAEKGEVGLRLSSAVPQWDSNLHCPYSYLAMGKLYLFLTPKTKYFIERVRVGKKSLRN